MRQRWMGRDQVCSTDQMEVRQMGLNLPKLGRQLVQTSQFPRCCENSAVIQSLSLFLTVHKQYSISHLVLWWKTSVPASTRGAGPAALEQLNMQPEPSVSGWGQDMALDIPLHSAVSAASPGRALLGVQAFTSRFQGFQLCPCPAAAGHLTLLLVNVLRRYPAYFFFFSSA